METVLCVKFGAAWLNLKDCWALAYCCSSTVGHSNLKGLFNYIKNCFWSFIGWINQPKVKTLVQPLRTWDHIPPKALMTVCVQDWLHDQSRAGAAQVTSAPTHTPHATLFVPGLWQKAPVPGRLPLGRVWKQKGMNGGTQGLLGRQQQQQ